MVVANPGRCERFNERGTTPVNHSQAAFRDISTTRITLVGDSPGHTRESEAYNPDGVRWDPSPTVNTTYLYRARALKTTSKYVHLAFLFFSLLTRVPAHDTPPPPPPRHQSDFPARTCCVSKGKGGGKRENGEQKEKCRGCSWHTRAAKGSGLCKPLTGKEGTARKTLR